MYTPFNGGDYLSVDNILINNSSTYFYNLSPEAYSLFNLPNISTTTNINRQLIQHYSTSILSCNQQIETLRRVLPQQIQSYTQDIIEYNTDMNIYINISTSNTNILNTYNTKNAEYISASTGLMMLSTALTISTSTFTPMINRINH